LGEIKAAVPGEFEERERIRLSYSFAAVAEDEEEPTGRVFERYRVTS